MNRIFISYSHKDGMDIAELLYERLKGCGYRVWKDDHSLPVGVDWPREISDAVEEGDYFIAVFTQGALESDWVQREIDMAFTAERRIIPVLVGNVKPPLYIRTIQSVFINSVDDWQALDKLVNALENGQSIPRVYNLSGHKDIEVNGILVLGHGDFRNPPLSDPNAIINTAKQMTELILPFLNAGAGIVPPGHPALACVVLAYCMGITTRLPVMFNTYRTDNDRYAISGSKCISLQGIREMGFEYRTRL